jgi:hypothetical protein
MKALYRDPGEAYTALDTSGKGYLVKEDLLESRAVERVMQNSKGQVDKRDVEEYIERERLFRVPINKNNASSGYKMDVEFFKRTFFP